MKKDNCCFVLASLVLLLYQAKVGYSGYTFPGWKVVADVRPFCLEVPPALKQKGVLIELDIYEARVQFANAVTIHYLQSI